jgi:hypothetical protein
MPTNALAVNPVLKLVNLALLRLLKFNLVLEHFTLEMLCKDLPKSLPRDGRRRVLLAVKRPSQALFALVGFI